jgi:flagellin
LRPSVRHNGAEQARLIFAADMLAENKTNFEAANSRIIDIDLSDESPKPWAWIKSAS